MIKIAPSILSADFADIKSALKMLENSKADMIHCDVMDGAFVPNITFGIKMIEDMKKYTSLPLDVHLMVKNPERFIDQFCNAGASIVTVHAEATLHLHSALQKIKNNGIKCGAVLNPASPIELIKHVLCDVDMVLVMSVNPGFGGQKFIPNTIEKISELKKIRDNNGYSFDIQVDGGIDLKTSKQVIAAGANILVSGNTIFSAENPANIISALRNER